MTIPISVKKPNKMILVYDDCQVELNPSDVNFDKFIFYTDEETLNRLIVKGVVVDAPIIPPPCGSKR